MKKKKSLEKLIMTLPVSLWMILLVAIPFIYVFGISFLEKGTYGGVTLSFTLENYKGVFNPLYMKVFGESFIIAAVVTVICVLIAYPFTYFIAQKTTIKKTVFMAMVTVPFLVPSLIRLFSWTNLLRKNGIINSFLINLGIIKEPLQLVYNEVGAIIGLIYILLPFMILPLYSSIDKLNRSYLEASSDLGAKPVTTFMKVTLPLTMPGIFAGSILVFIPALGLYYVTDLLGGSKTQLVGNIIKNEFITARNWPMGAALAIFLVLITLVMVWLYQKSGGDMDELGV
nr:ABC transporter permease [uncultured Cellulosilyticum sp.]